MRTALRLLALSGFLCFTGMLTAQPVADPPQEIRPTLRKMTTSQKMQVLDYLRSAGADLNREIQQVYEQLPPEKRSRAIQYMDLVMKGFDNIPRTTVVWNQDTVHYGRIESGSIVLDSFKVTNTGVYPYIISDLKTSCECTVLQFPKYPVLPGETATIRVEFDSQGKLGHTTPGIVVYDNSSPNARNIFYLDGMILPRVKKKNIIED